MKNLKLLILLLFITVLCNGQNHWIKLSASYSPTHIFEPKSIPVTAAYCYGNEDLRIEGFVQSDSNFTRMLAGLHGYITIIGRPVQFFGEERNFTFSFVGGHAVLTGSHNEDKHGDPHRSHYTEAGFDFDVEAGKGFSLNLAVKNQYYNQDEGIFYTQFGVCYKIK